MKQTFLVLIAIFSLVACSSDDDSSSNNNETETEYYTVTLTLKGVSGAGYNTRLRINTFHEASANIYGVYESQNEIQWNDGVIEHTFIVDAETANGVPLTSVTCSVETTLHQEYSYAIDYFIFTAILKDSDGNIVLEQTTNEDATDGWLTFNSFITFEL